MRAFVIFKIITRSNTPPKNFEIFQETDYNDTEMKVTVPAEMDTERKAKEQPITERRLDPTHPNLWLSHTALNTAFSGEKLPE